MYLIAEIRRRHLVDGESLSSIARTMNISRPTIRKYLDTIEEPVYKRKTQPCSKLIPAYKELLTQWLEDDAKLPKKQRRTGQRLFECLQKEGYQGAVDSVWRFIRRWKSERNANPPAKQAFVPLSFSPGEVCQFDWSEETVELNKTVQSIKVAHFRMAYSRKPFVVAYPNEQLEMVLDAHIRAFQFYGGVPDQMIYDNPKTMIDKVLPGKERKFNRRFMALVNHYLFKPVACTPASGWEKGQVENQVGNIREWLFTPRLKFDDIETLNGWLSMRCNDLSQRTHPTQKSRTIADCFTDEETKLRVVNAPFNGFTEHLLRVSRTCLVRFDYNQYSVPAQWVGQVLCIRVSAYQLQVVAKDQVIAEHKRCFLKDQVICNPWHYLSILEKKPGALRHGTPFKEWELPPAIQQIRHRLSQQEKGDREFVNILLLSQESGLELLETACELVLESGVINISAIQNQIQRLLEPSKPANLNTVNDASLTIAPSADCTPYDALIGGDDYVH